MQLGKLLWREKTFLLTLFVIAFLLRGFLFYVYLQYGENCLLGFDTPQYQAVAMNITQGNGISTAPGVPNFYRLPGYPLFLAACYHIFGFNDTSVLWFQILLACLIPILVFLLALVLFPSQVLLAKISGLWTAVHVGFILYAGLLGTETLFEIFFLLFLILFFMCYKPAWCSGEGAICKASTIFIAGILLGLASLIRAVGHHVLYLTFLVILIAAWSWKDKIKAVILLSSGWLLAAGWWLLRNYLLTGYLFMHALPGLHFLQYSGVHALMGYVNFGDDAYFQTKKRVLQEWDCRIQQEAARVGHPLNEYERYDVAGKLAWTYLKENPLVSIKNAVVNMVRSCFTLYSSLFLYVPAGTVYERGTSLWFKIKLYLVPRVYHPCLVYFVYWEVVSALLMFLGFLLFFAYAWFDRSLWCVACTTIPLILFIIFLTLGYGCARLRLPAEPLMIILASAGWCLLYQRLTIRQ